MLPVVFCALLFAPLDVEPLLEALVVEPLLEPLVALLLVLFVWLFFALVSDIIYACLSTFRFEILVPSYYVRNKKIYT